MDDDRCEDQEEQGPEKKALQSSVHGQLWQSLISV